MAAFEEIDVHSLTKTEALARIDAFLKHAAPSVYSLRIIHGYHCGTVLQAAVRKHYASHPKVLRIELGLNPGETELVLKQL